jgi:hypothetical protein
MKRWFVTHTKDTETYLVDEVEGETYTRAYANAMTAFPGDTITDLREA